MKDVPSGGSVCHDVTSDRFFRVSLKHCTSINLSNDLICNDNSNSKLQFHIKNQTIVGP